MTYSIPYLQFDLLACYIDHSSSEFNTYGQVVFRCETLVCELQQQTRFANTSVSNDNVFEQICVCPM